MQLARVIGTTTSTVKHPSLSGWKLLIVQPFCTDDKTPDGEPVLAIDALGAGKGQTVMITSDGKSTRELVGDNKTPARWSVIGIRDREEFRVQGSGSEASRLRLPVSEPEP